MIGAYWAVVQARFRMMLQYRAAAVAGFGTQLFWGLIRVMIFEAFYLNSTSPQTMTFAQTVSYVWLSQAMFRLLPMRGDTEFRSMVRQGTVAYELVRPIDLYWFWFSRTLASQIAPVLLRAVPMLVIARLFLGLQAPASAASGAAFLVSVIGAMLLSSAIVVLMTISLLWTISGEGASQLLSLTAVFLSGIYVPLPFFPDWAQGILNVLPFRGLMDVPFRLYNGHIPPQQVLALFAQQLAWTTALVLLGRWALSRGARRLVVQGG